MGNLPAYSTTHFGRRWGPSRHAAGALPPAALRLAWGVTSAPRTRPQLTATQHTRQGEERTAALSRPRGIPDGQSSQMCAFTPRIIEEIPPDSDFLTPISSRAHFVWQLQRLDGGFNLLEFGILVHQRGIAFLCERRDPGISH